MELSSALTSLLMQALICCSATKIALTRKRISVRISTKGRRVGVGCESVSSSSFSLAAAATFVFFRLAELVREETCAEEEEEEKKEEEVPLLATEID